MGHFIALFCVCVCGDSKFCAFSFVCKKGDDVTDLSLHHPNMYIICVIIMGLSGWWHIILVE